jgi:hypothetical protein
MVQEFIKLFVVVLLFIAVPLGIWMWADRLRGKKKGCSGSHDCVVYKGERVMCPSCELREHQASRKKKEHSAALSD